MPHTLTGIEEPIQVVDAVRDGRDSSLISKVGVKRGGESLPMVWILVDKSVENHPETQAIIAAANLQGKMLLVTTIEGGEDCKSVETLVSVTTAAYEFFQRAPTRMIAIGGGSVLNLATFIAACMENEGLYFGDHKSYMPYRPNAIQEFIVVPTTILALADVAYGSKGNMNMQNAEHHIALGVIAQKNQSRALAELFLSSSGIQKHGWKLYRDPDEIFASAAYIQTLPVEEIKRGLSEVLKHALLQDQSTDYGALNGLARVFRGIISSPKRDFRGMPRLSDVVGQIKNPDPSVCFDLAMQTMFAKSCILRMDVMEESWVAGLLSYGHLHAHALEMASDFKIGHGESVFLGILIDLKLAGSEHLYRQVLKLAPDLPMAKHLSEYGVNKDRLKDAYEHEPKAFFKDKDSGDFKILPLDKKGRYNKFLSKHSPSPQKPMSLDTMIKAYEEVLGDLEILLEGCHLIPVGQVFGLDRELT